jgi:wyosine [tRNA(Phe)-imidazoG37] synthetase (radical SAM superfamily)
MPRTDVRLDLSFFDIVVAKIDAPNEELFTRINRPFIDYTLDGILQGIRISRERARSKLALQMMFIEAKQDKAQEMAESARCLQPDEVQLNAPCGPVRCHPKSFRHEGDRGCLRRFERGPGLQKRATSAGPCGRS